MQPNPNELIEALGLEIPLVGVYDAPDVSPFEPLVAPSPGKRVCLFEFYDQWLRGRTVRLTKDAYGCQGAGSCLLSLQTRSTEDMVSFLIDGEGLKQSREIMREYVERRRTYRPEHGNLLIGPLRSDQYAYLKTVIFFVDPDQLGALVVGAHYRSGPDDPSPVGVPFGSGCSQLLPVFGDLNAPRAMIGATDSAARVHLPPNVLTFAVTKPMFQQLCELDERSFLHKPFWRNLCRARGASR